MRRWPFLFFLLFKQLLMEEHYNLENWSLRIYESRWPFFCSAFQIFLLFILPFQSSFVRDMMEFERIQTVKKGMTFNFLFFLFYPSLDEIDQLSWHFTYIFQESSKIMEKQTMKWNDYLLYFAFPLRLGQNNEMTTLFVFHSRFVAT